MVFRHHSGAWVKYVVAGAILAVVVGWPFSALCFVPIGLDVILLSGFPLPFLHLLGSVGTVGVASFLVDTHFYGVPVLGPNVTHPCVLFCLFSLVLKTLSVYTEAAVYIQWF